MEAPICAWNAASLPAMAASPSRVRASSSSMAKMSVFCAGVMLNESFAAGAPVIATLTPRKLMLCPEVNPVPDAITTGVGVLSSTTCQSVALVNCSV